MSQINIFKIQKGRETEFESFVRKSYKKVGTTQQNGFCFELMYQAPLNDQPVSWGWVFGLLDKQAEKIGTMPKGILIIKKRDNATCMYAVSFGGAHFHIGKFCDTEFGFDFASRVMIQKTMLSVTVNKNSKKNKTINSYKDFEHLEINSGESYTKLKFAIRLEGDAVDLIRNVIEVGSSLKVCLIKDSVSNVLKLISYIEKTLEGVVRTKIPIFNLVTKADEIHSLDKHLCDDFLRDETTVTISEFDVIGTTEVFNRAEQYEISCAGQFKKTTVLNWQILKEFFNEKKISDANVMLRTGIKFLVNGESKVTRAIRELIDYYFEGGTEERSALLVRGQWYRFNQYFCDYLKASLSELDIYYDEKYDIRDTQVEAFRKEMCDKHKEDAKYKKLSQNDYEVAIRKKYYYEYVFNLLREKEGFEIKDRMMVPWSGGEEIEVYDLKKDDVIFAVKRGDASSALTYAVTQSEAAIDYYMDEDKPKNTRPHSIALWFILPKRKRLQTLKGNRLDWDEIRMLLLKIRIDNWRKKVLLANMKPEIHINYEIKDAQND